MILLKPVSCSFFLLWLCFASSPGSAQAVIDDTTASGKRQGWLRKSTSDSPEKESAIFYVNAEDPGKILIFLGKQAYLLDTRYSAVLPVTSTLPEPDGDFETGELTTEVPKDVVANAQRVMGTLQSAN
jgi:hypothetical protein